MTTEGSAEVPAGDARAYPYEDNPGGTHWEGCYRAPRHHNCAVARLYECHDEIARLEARLAEVEAERDTWRGLAERAEPVVEAMLSALLEQEASLDALRAAVRPLVEAAEEADDYLLHMPFQTMTEAAIVSSIRAALVDPAIAALLDQQKEQG
jgi:3-methyladenine DNA glycosylase/8-oxoguanine DNA glycosylase